mgnify:FL=1
MKKPITIPNVDIELYENIKEHCKQEGTSISTFFNSMLAAATLSKEEAENKKIKELTAQTVQLTEQLARAKRYIAEQEKEQSKHADEYTELEVENKKLLDYNDELKQNQTAKDAELEEAKKALETLKNQIESLRKTSSDNGVFVELSPLELALIEHVATKERERRKDNNITPAGLLKAMFVNYTIHGDMYFFPHPSRSTLRDLKAKIEAQNQEKNEE